MHATDILPIIIASLCAGFALGYGVATTRFLRKLRQRATPRTVS